MSRVLGEVGGFEVPAIVRTPSQLRALAQAADGIPPLLDRGRDATSRWPTRRCPARAAAELDAWDRPGERARVLGSEVLAEFGIAFHRTTLTNARIERITGRTTTWRDLSVVRAVDERWGT